MRKAPKYRCANCKHEFDTPAYIPLDELISTFYEKEEALEVRDKCFISKQWKYAHSLSGVRYWMQREWATTRDAG